MKKHLVWAAVVGVTAAVTVGAWAMGEDKEKGEGDEVKVTLDQVPAAVKETLVKEAGGAAITSVDKETDDGKVVYETDVTSGGKNWEIKVDGSGNLISKKEDNEEDEKGEKGAAKKDGKEDDEKGEVKLSIDAAPAAVREALAKEDGGAAVKTVDKETTKDGKVVYEADVTSGGKNWEIKYDENGKVVSKAADNEEGEKKSGKGEDEEKEGRHQK